MFEFNRIKRVLQKEVDLQRWIWIFLSDEIKNSLFEKFEKRWKIIRII